ncbi:MarR family transcriptional regulator [bacterium]|nr:MarR family transcriptional regulator [bacterium]
MERNINLRDNQRELIEKFGVFMDRSGMSPAEGRVLGLLAVADVTELTFDEIHETLGLSKGAVSNALNRLQNLNRIEYITKPGDRKRYFRLELKSWEKMARDKFKASSEIGNIYLEILEQRTSSTPEFNEGLARLVSFMNFMRRELPMLFAKWERENS